MKARLISKLTGSGENTKIWEDFIIESLDEIIEESSFYTLPTDEILKIIEKANPEDIDLLCKIISKMCENKEKEAVLLLNMLNPQNITFEEWVKLFLASRAVQFASNQESYSQNTKETLIETIYMKLMNFKNKMKN